ncbi:MAG: AMP-dependent synthetase, partial [Methylococcales bacterium]
MAELPAPLSHFLVTSEHSQATIAHHAGQSYSVQQFAHAVKYWVKQFQSQESQRYALYTEDA